MVPPKRSPYARVEVIGLLWEGPGDQRRDGPVYNAFQEFALVMDAFKRYGYGTHRLDIHQDPRHRSGFCHRLQQKIDHFTRSAGFHASYPLISRTWPSRQEEWAGALQYMPWAVVADAVISANCDVLTILNCCHAGAALNTPLSVRRNLNYERHLKEIMMETIWDGISQWGTNMGFAACLERVLREQ
ncbi:hypothetical protein QBC38DRAFT_501594 [Podospora fimiseda]|uniref:Uncharacterized protein n=1 Tax=Podospora fimiseda TaxID=252190 RepID=A0AAN7BKT3_9PEZI|nr:hypothetical protein QBC38DRAFT_501594 [Podospora fimiseda]